MSEEQFEEFVRKAAQEHLEPPPTPREEIWNRIQAARRQQAAQGKATGVVDLASRRRPMPRWFGGLLAAAALLAIGIGLGRYGFGRPAVDPQVAPPTVAVTETTDSARATAVLRYAAVNTLSQVQTLLTDYEADRIDEQFQADAHELLSQTRMLLGSTRLTDPRIKKLLEDLELLLVQVARLNHSGQGEERGYIDDGMAERAIRQRLRSAIPAGPTA